jgi:hypothetical protein
MAAPVRPAASVNWWSTRRTSRPGAPPDLVALSEPQSDVVRMTDPDSVVCTQCCSAVQELATTCPYCQATRRSVTAAKWLSYREGRRNDIVIAYFCVVLVLVAVGLVLGLLVGGTGALKTSITPTTTCSVNLRSLGVC